MSSMKAWKLGVLGLVALMMMLGGLADSALANGLEASSPTGSLTAGSSGNTITFNLSGIDTALGPITVTPPSGWTAMQTGDAAVGGYTTGVTAAGSPAAPALGLTIEDSATSITIIYGDINPSTGEGGVDAQTTVGPATFTFEQLLADESSADPANVATVTVLTEVAGSGAITPSSTTNLGGVTGVSYLFTYTAVGDGASNGGVLDSGTFTLSIPNAFPDPTSRVAVAASVGDPVLGTGVISAGASASTLTIPITQMDGGDAFTITYSDITIPVNGSSDPTEYEFTAKVGF